MKKKKNKLMILLVAVVVVLIAVFSVVSKMTAGPAPLPQVEVAAVTQGDIAQELDATGSVESERKKTFYSPVNGEIKEMDVTTGDMVKKGQKLITFDLETLEQENQKAELNVLAGRYEYQNTLKKSGEAAQKQADARANVGTLEDQVASWKQYVSDLKREISQITADDAADAAKKQKEAADALAEQERKLTEQYQKEVKLYQEKTLPEYKKELAEALEEKNRRMKEYYTADTEYQLAFETWSADQSAENRQVVSEKEEARSQAQIALTNAEAAYSQLEANPPVAPQAPAAVSKEIPDINASGDTALSTDTSQLQNELEEASATLAELQSELASQKAVAESDAGTITAEEKARMETTNNLTELEEKSLEELIAEGKKGIQAEFTGVISEAQVNQGASVTQGMQMFTLLSTEDVSIQINVSKYDYSKLKEGQKAEITLGGNTYQGTVTKINRIAVPNEKGTPMIGATVHIDNPDENIFLGVDAKVVIAAASAKGVLKVPTSVVNIGKEGSFCYVVEDGVIVKKPVETGLSSDSEVEITSGLSKGDAVVLDMGNYAEGDAVEAMNSETAGEEETQQ